MTTTETLARAVALAKQAEHARDEIKRLDNQLMSIANLIRQLTPNHPQHRDLDLWRVDVYNRVSVLHSFAQYCDEQALELLRRVS